MNIICLLFGHKNHSEKYLGITDGRRYYVGQNSPWYCMRCGKYTQKLYFNSLLKK
jgi:hypothetical protein